MDKLRIAEIFTSIQGEGSLVGVPSVFIRVSGCNLRCGWCDTPYASWSPEGPTMNLPDILLEVEKSKAKHVVLTGGEPMLFDAIEPLCRELTERGFHITIETAGTIYREVACDLMSISPKLSNSTPSEEIAGAWSERHEQTRLDREPLKQLVEKYPFQLKFVVNPDNGLEDLGEIEEILRQLPKEARRNVLLMPEGVESETLQRRGRILSDVCIELGFRLSPRMHVDLWGARRGV